MMATTGLSLYDSTATAASTHLLRAYSSSFQLACRLCSPTVRRQIANLYALVRIADEIVDGPAAEAGLTQIECERLLDALEHETEQALAHGYSANIVVHAFARTARERGIGITLTRPFFASMRRDLRPVRFETESELDEYVYGSAEVVGLMCLRVFSEGLPPDPAREARWEAAARALGSAFQRVNFLRDLGEDALSRGRLYFPGIDPDTFTDAQRDRLLDRIEADLRVALAVIPELPTSARRAVAVAAALYQDLARQLRGVPAAEIAARRVRVPTPRKLALAALVIGGRR